MIAFGPPHDPNSPEGIEYAASQERVRQIRRDVAKKRADILREMEAGIKENDASINAAAGTFIAAIAVPAILWGLAYLWIFGG